MDSTALGAMCAVCSNHQPAVWLSTCAHEQPLRVLLARPPCRRHSLGMLLRVRGAAAGGGVCRRGRAVQQAHACLPFEGNGGQQSIECALPVGCDDHDAVPQVVGVTHFALRAARRPLHIDAMTGRCPVALLLCGAQAPGWGRQPARLAMLAASLCMTPSVPPPPRVHAATMLAPMQLPASSHRVVTAHRALAGQLQVRVDQAVAHGSRDGCTHLGTDAGDGLHRPVGATSTAHARAA